MVDPGRRPATGSGADCDNVATQDEARATNQPGPHLGTAGTLPRRREAPPDENPRAAKKCKACLQTIDEGIYCKRKCCEEVEKTKAKHARLDEERDPHPPKYRDYSDRFFD